MPLYEYLCELYAGDIRQYSAEGFRHLFIVNPQDSVRIIAACNNNTNFTIHESQITTMMRTEMKLIIV